MAPAMPFVLSLLLSTATARVHHLNHPHQGLEERAPLAPASTLPSNWTYSGCYSDNQGARTLSGANTYDTSGMNATSCIAFCTANKFVYAGTQYSQQCFCGNSVSSGTLQTDGTCNMACSGNANEVCGGPNLLTVYYANKAPPAPPSVNPGPPGWTSYGCWAEGNNRVLGNTVEVAGGASNVSIASCTTACAAAGYTLAGAEYSSQCFCDNYVAKGVSNVTLSDCNMLCNGNSSEFCGGANRLNLYAAGKTVPTVKPVPVIVPPPGGWFSVGCYNDTVGTRTLTQAQYGLGDLTVDKCAAACFKAGYRYSGSEYANECFCDNYFQNYGAAVTDGRCNMGCKGNTNQTCGGPNGLSVYQYTGWFNAGCYNDTVGVRTLSQAQYGLGDLTVEKCTAACKAAGYTLAGMEYGNECFCDNAPQNYGKLQDPTSCSMACKGNANQLCGGPNRLTVFSYNATGVVTPTASATPNPGTGNNGGNNGGANNPPAPVASNVVNASAILPFVYQGCFSDNSPKGRTLAYAQPDNKGLTVESCIATCSSLGYSIAGMEYSSQCYCDNYIKWGPTNLTSNANSCNMNCAGNANQRCGAGSQMSIYSNGTMTPYIAPTTLTSYKNWTYTACYTDYDAKRNLPFSYKMTNQKNNTNEACMDLCGKFGYNVAGTEYGEECWCGDTQNIIDNAAEVRPDTECNMLCSNDTGKNGGHFCGGSGRMSAFTWAGPVPLYKWNFATGQDAGAYQFLIGSVNIPLITAPARNGKVTYVSKFGTEPAANSTGAYELDLASLNNFTAAWRPMHVKTDVFCAAGITLPDRAGRQLMVGGWANDDTHGIRTYWPDGLPGKWGKNDWQEAVKEVSLKTGRWYPSAMIMANGSILVIGGEVGSNGAPVKDLELLPWGGSTVPTKYLMDTDPYSTYPYVCVLPSGGIFVAYYNEARILDPVTLTTKQELPNIPGSVSNFLGGRTYPFEGTSMLLPQHAPYTDYLRILICGGSIPGPEFALDNCVTIAPDEPNPHWEIERMPSRRVMSCMTALPDGTYLITCGARQGRAGFGLASDPNFSAVLYDPTQPLHQRMTVMANTTVARFYHSEAVLLDDARVLISGSDPEDNRPFAPQEYRNEVFVPPYLLKGAPRPKFTVSTDDWAYGQTVTLTVIPSSGADISGYRVSLLGAVSSTHGNSMNQRTLFPAISCSGTTCTVTAPPNANICPPSWFQMYLLDSNNIPSNATWVRVGGDPGNLGNWPNTPSFQPLPGVGPVLPVV